MKVNAIDHIHINVRDLERAIRLFTELTGHEYPEPLVIEDLKMRIAWNWAGIELQEPVSADSPVAKSIDTWGEGIATLSFGITDIETRVHEAEALGLRLVSRIGADYELQAQFHPKESFGVMLELVERLEGYAEAYLPRPVDSFHEIVDHVHIYVRDLTKSTALFAALTDTEFSAPVIIDEIGARTATSALGIELIQPTVSDSPIARTIERLGEGVHAIALKVDNLEDGISKAQVAGLKLVSQVNHERQVRQAQFAPQDSFGVMVEFVERLNS